jgi:uncharacterized protein YcfJ
MKNTILATALAGLISAQVASADIEQFSIKAPVISVVPIVQTVTDKIPHRSCHDELVRVERRGRHHSRVPQVLGAVIGGAAAGAIGDNTGHQGIIATAGALLGAAIGQDAAYRNNTRSQYVTEERCTIDYELRDREIVTGYRVGYRYDGNIYHTRTTQRPGDTIRLNVVVEPDIRG